MSHFWFGRVGSLVELTRISPPAENKPSKSAVVHELARGRAVDVFPIRRTWTLPAIALDDAERSVLDQAFWLPGPYRLIVANQINQLTVQQSSGTDDLYDTTGFIATSGTLSSSTAQVRSGLRSLAWAVSSGLAAGNGVWTGSAATTTAAADDVPVVVGKDYTFSFYVRHSTGTVQLRATINWFTAAGVSVSTSTGTSTSSSTANFDTRCTLTATAPATAAYARCECEIGTGTPSASMTIYLDQLQFEQASAVSAWVLGKGVPIVSVTEMDATEILVGRADHSLVLVEVG